MGIYLLLGRTKTFQGVPQKALEEIAQFTERLIFEPKFNQHEVVISADSSSGPALYLILAGRVTLDKEIDKTHSEGSGVINLLEEEIFGEVSWVLKQARVADVHTSTRVVMLRIDGEKLEQFLLANPEVAALVWQRIAQATAKRLSLTFAENQSRKEQSKIFNF